jgi:hypothetical protein
MNKFKLVTITTIFKKTFIKPTYMSSEDANKDLEYFQFDKCL